ncbi:hypothetical protein IRJ41_013014 [Triplophysa rosa]|uniref:Uncharacterized protein n=1 Tax=Triplophysa rosa TaxID=992332 RepID=A0A9W7TVM5_TRIRA|nr:hypothetical protein IRJ41_013014 [Triplophysa rosa]
MIERARESPSVSRHRFYFHGNGYPTSNIKAITICYTAIIAIIENSRAVKETSTLSTDAPHTRGSPAPKWSGVQHVFPISAVTHRSPQSDLISPLSHESAVNGTHCGRQGRGQKSRVGGGRETGGGRSDKEAGVSD